VHVIREYYNRFYRENKIEPIDEKIREDVSTLSKRISRGCSDHRRLLDPDPQKDERKIQIAKQQYVNGVPAYEKQ
jgi:hypothetical protein